MSQFAVQAAIVCAVRGILDNMLPPRTRIFGTASAVLLAAALVSGSALAQTPPSGPPKTPPAAKDAPKDAPKAPAKDAAKDAPRAPKKDGAKDSKKVPPAKKADKAEDAKSAESTDDAGDAVDAETAKYAKIAASGKFKDYVNLAAERQKLFQKSSKLRMAMRGTEPSQKQLDDLADIQKDMGKVNERMDSFMTGKTFSQDELMALEWIVQEQMRLHPLE